MVLGEEAEQRILFSGRRNVGGTVSAEGADRGASLALAKAGGQAARVLDDGDCGDVRRAKLSGSYGTTPRFAKHTSLVGITDGFAL